MTLRLLCVGRIKESWYRDAIGEYLKRLSKYALVEVVEVADEKAPESLGERDRARITAAEGERLLSKLSPDEYLIALDIKGETLSSEGLARRIDDLMTGGRSRIAFAVGGSLGLSPAVLERADMRLSFGAMTFPHQLFRVMLLEQIYRAFRIIKGEPYHK